MKHVASGIDIDVTFGGLPFEQDAVANSNPHNIAGVQSVDHNMQSYLTAPGSLSEQAGEQAIPLTGTANISVASYESPGALPLRYDVRLLLEERIFRDWLFSEINRQQDISPHSRS
jgi:hypothetical protein